MIKLCIAILLIAAAAATAQTGVGNFTTTIEFYALDPDQMHEHARELVAPFGMERVRLDLSLDDGQTWSHNIALGIQPDPGLNVYEWTVNITTNMWTESARVAVRTLWSSTTNEILQWQGDMSAEAFSICGLHIIEPACGSDVAIPTYLPIKFNEAGFDYVDILISTNSPSADVPPVVEHIVTLATPGAGIKTYELPLTDYPHGPFWVIVWGASNFYDYVELNLTGW